MKTIQCKQSFLIKTSAILIGLQASPVLATPEKYAAVANEYRWLTFLVFSSIIAATMYITYWASKT